MQSAGGAITRASHARSTSDHWARHSSRPGFQETSMSELLGGCRCGAVRYALMLDLPQTVTQVMQRELGDLPAAVEHESLNRSASFVKSGG